MKVKVKKMVVKKKLLNYTSTVSASKSIAYIEETLARHGASMIIKKYTVDGKVKAICFTKKIETFDMPFQLPAKVDECEKLLKEYISRPRKGTLDRIREQAERTAWKLVSDWVEVQMNMLSLNQVEFMQVFLPYAYNDQKEQTYYEALKEKGFKALLPAAI